MSGRDFNEVHDLLELTCLLHLTEYGKRPVKLYLSEDDYETYEEGLVPRIRHINTREDKVTYPHGIPIYLVSAEKACEPQT